MVRLAPPLVRLSPIPALSSFFIAPANPILHAAVTPRTGHRYLFDHSSFKPIKLYRHGCLNLPSTRCFSYYCGVWTEPMLPL
jgi:hypothetical protein